MVPRDRGHIVNISSQAGKFGAPGGATYSATKHAVVPEGLGDGGQCDADDDPVQDGHENGRQHDCQHGVAVRGRARHLDSSVRFQKRYRPVRQAGPSGANYFFSFVIFKHPDVETKSEGSSGLAAHFPPLSP